MITVIISAFYPDKNHSEQREVVVVNSEDIEDMPTEIQNSFTAAE
jgi:hypothetical protein